MKKLYIYLYLFKVVKILTSKKLVPFLLVYRISLLLLLLILLIIILFFLVPNSQSKLVMITPFVGTPGDFELTWPYPMLDDPSYEVTRTPPSFKNKPDSKTPIGGIGFYDKSNIVDFFILNKNLLVKGELFKEIYSSLLFIDTYQAFLKEEGLKTISLCTSLKIEDVYYYEPLHPFMLVDDKLTPEQYWIRVKNRFIFEPVRNVDINWFLMRAEIGHYDKDMKLNLG